MGWMSKLIEHHKHKAKCLICDEICGENAAVVEYRYDGGTGKAFICEKCADEMDKTVLDDIDDAV